MAVAPRSSPRPSGATVAPFDRPEKKDLVRPLRRTYFPSRVWSRLRRRGRPAPSRGVRPQEHRDLRRPPGDSSAGWRPGALRSLCGSARPWRRRTPPRAGGTPATARRSAPPSGRGRGPILRGALTRDGSPPSEPRIPPRAWGARPGGRRRRDCTARRAGGRRAGRPEGPRPDSAGAIRRRESKDRTDVQGDLQRAAPDLPDRDWAWGARPGIPTARSAARTNRAHDRAQLPSISERPNQPRLDAAR